MTKSALVLRCAFKACDVNTSRVIFIAVFIYIFVQVDQVDAFAQVLGGIHLYEDGNDGYVAVVAKLAEHYWRSCEN